jgi:predicted kinase
MAPHVVDILRHGLSVVLDFPANTVEYRQWMQSLAVEAKVAHELHFLDMSDQTCLQRLRARNLAGEHAFQVDETQFEIFTAYFDPPPPEEGFDVIVHAG